MTPEDPILVVDRIETSSEHASGELQIGDHRERVQLGMSIPGLIEFEHLPDVLGRIPQARNAVIDLVTRVHRGEVVGLPVDLSDIVRQSSEPWPTRRPPEPVEDASASVEVTEIMHDAPEPGLTTIHLRVRGVASVVVVDTRDGPCEPLRFRFEAGVHPWHLTPAEGNAMLMALVRALQRPSLATRVPASP